MNDTTVASGRFVVRRNRFIAEVEIDGRVETCHVKNTGRLKELLLPGARVILSVSDNPNRKTKYDLVAVYAGDVLVNIDSQAPNQVAADYLPHLFPGAAALRAEVPFGESRLDFYLEAAGRPTYIEVKGVTLLTEGAALFPDAPTERGLKHIRELIRAAEAGYGAGLLFVVQRPDAIRVSPNDATQPAFGEALRLAANRGVGLYAVDCTVTEKGLMWRRPLSVAL